MLKNINKFELSKRYEIMTENIQTMLKLKMKSISLNLSKYLIG